MGYSYLIISNTGVIQKEIITPISKGNNKVDTIRIAFQDHDFNDAYVTLTATFPDGTQSVELATVEDTFTYPTLATEYNGFKYVVTEYLTAQAGELTITLRLKSNSTGAVLCSTQKVFTIRDNDVPTDPNITDEQYQSLLASIAGKLNKNYSGLDNVELNRLENTYYVVNDNGVPKKVKVSDTRKILTVNGVSPDNNKNIEITPNDIDYGESTVKIELDNINAGLLTLNQEKADKTEVVYSREGSLTPSSAVLSGLLPYKVSKTATDLYNYRVRPADADGNDDVFFNGDLLQVIVKITKGNSNEIYKYNLMLDADYLQDYYQVERTLGLTEISIYGGNGYIEFGFTSVGTTDITDVQFESVLIRR